MELKPTAKVAEALAIAQRTATSEGNPEITPAHLALALAEQPDTTTPALLAAGVSINSRLPSSALRGAASALCDTAR